MRNELLCAIFLLSLIGGVVPLQAQPPAGWTAIDIGNPAVAGSVEYDEVTETWTIRGGGTGIRDKADEFHFVYKRLSGNGELVARVASIDPPLSDWSMAGLMIRLMLVEAPYRLFSHTNRAGTP